MKQLIKEHTYYADEMICPYCKHKFTEDYSYEAYGNDTEANHCFADGILCDLLIELGYQEVVDEWELVHKWYA